MTKRSEYTPAIVRRALTPGTLGALQGTGLLARTRADLGTPPHDSSV